MSCYVSGFEAWVTVADQCVFLQDCGRQSANMDNADSAGGCYGDIDTRDKFAGTLLCVGRWVSVYVTSYSHDSNTPGLTNLPTGGLGYIRFLAPPDKVIRWIEGKLNLLGRVPHYVSVDQKTYGRYGVLPTSANEQPHSNAIGLGWVGTNNGGQRLGAS